MKDCLGTVLTSLPGTQPEHAVHPLLHREEDDGV